MLTKGVESWAGEFGVATFGALSQRGVCLLTRLLEFSRPLRDSLKTCDGGGKTRAACDPDGSEGSGDGNVATVEKVDGTACCVRKLSRSVQR